LFLYFCLDTYDFETVEKLWDRLLCLPSAVLPLVTISLLYAHREKLLEMNFNECILFFSNLPTMNVPLCIAYSLWMHRITPPSLFEKFEFTEEPNLNEDIEGSICHISWNDVANCISNYVVIIDIRRKKQ
jgi:hypothetical protein